MNGGYVKKPGPIAAYVVMRRQVFSGAFLFVEGETDEVFFRPRVDGAACKVIDCGGKPNVLAVVADLEGKSGNPAVAGVIGVVDDDCDQFDRASCAGPNLLPIPNARDLESMLFWTASLDRLLATRADPAELQKQGGVAGVRQQVMALVGVLGQLRRVALQNRWPLTFDQMGPGRFIDQLWQWKADGREPVRIAAGIIGISEPEVVRALASLPPIPDPYLCQGHDIIALLHMAIRSGGALGGKQLDRLDVTTALFLGLDTAEWAATALYAELRAWQWRNPGFMLLWSS